MSLQGHAHKHHVLSSSTLDVIGKGQGEISKLDLQSSTHRYTSSAPKSRTTYVRLIKKLNHETFLSVFNCFVLRVLPWISRWPWTLRNSPASASQVLGLKGLCPHTHQGPSFLIYKIDTRILPYKGASKCKLYEILKQLNARCLNA